jgi:hypothetical protein
MKLDDLTVNVGLVLALALVVLLGYLEYHRRVEGRTRLWMILARFVLLPMLLAFVLSVLLRLSRLG